MMDLKILNKIALIFVLIGGIDLGLYGLLGFHLVELIFGTKFLGRLLFILMGLSAGYLIYEEVKKRKTAG